MGQEKQSAAYRSNNRHPQCPRHRGSVHQHPAREPADDRRDQRVLFDLEVWVHNTNEPDQDEKDEKQQDGGQDLDRCEEDGNVLGCLQNLETSRDEGGHLGKGDVDFFRVRNAHSCSRGILAHWR